MLQIVKLVVENTVIQTFSPWILRSGLVKSILEDFNREDVAIPVDCVSLESVKYFTTLPSFSRFEYKYYTDVEKLMDYFACDVESQKGLVTMLYRFKTPVPEQRLFNVMSTHKLCELQGNTSECSRLFLDGDDANYLARTGKYTSKVLSTYCQEHVLILDNTQCDPTPLLLELQSMLENSGYFIITGEYMMNYSLGRGHTEENIAIIATHPRTIAKLLGNDHKGDDYVDLYMDGYTNLIRLYKDKGMFSRKTLTNRDDCLVCIDERKIFCTASWHLRGEHIYQDYCKSKQLPLYLDTRVWNELRESSKWTWARRNDVRLEYHKPIILETDYRVLFENRGKYNLFPHINTRIRRFFTDIRLKSGVPSDETILRIMKLARDIVNDMPSKGVVSKTFFAGIYSRTDPSPGKFKYTVMVTGYLLDGYLVVMCTII